MLVYHAGAVRDDTGELCKLCDMGAVRGDPALLLAQIVTCPDCVGLLCLALATPAERCPYCTVPTAEGHTYNCPVTWIRPCAICGEETLPRDLAMAPDGKFECRTCRTEHPRSGRYSFAASGDRGTKHHRPVMR